MTALKIETTGNGRAVATRFFAATPAQVYRAHIDPDLIQQWMGVMEGFTMSECMSDPRPGGGIRFAWVGPDGEGFHITGEYISLDEPHEIRHVERMHVPDPTPDNNCHTTFEAKDGGTLLTLIMQLPDDATLKEMLDTGMEAGMEASYTNIDTLFANAG